MFMFNYFRSTVIITMVTVKFLSIFKPLWHVSMTLNLHWITGIGYFIHIMSHIKSENLIMYKYRQVFDPAFPTELCMKYFWAMNFPLNFLCSHRLWWDIMSPGCWNGYNWYRLQVEFNDLVCRLLRNTFKHTLNIWDGSLEVMIVRTNLCQPMKMWFIIYNINLYKYMYSLISAFFFVLLSSWIHLLCSTIFFVCLLCLHPTFFFHSSIYVPQFFFLYSSFHFCM